MSHRQCVFALVLFVPLLAVNAPAQLKAIDLQGKTIDLSQAAGNRANVLIFVRTDCPISNRYAPVLRKLSSEYAKTSRFWLVYPDNTESATAIEEHLRDYNYKNISAIRDPQHTLVRIARAQITPEAAVFDHHARLLYHGRIDNWYQSFGHSRPRPTTHELEEAIRAIRDHRPVAVAETKAVGCYIADVQ
ncbi:MAG TPA: redoxin family protein [Terriglobales bacterium]|nr:redoxin family protein [Terriglobales bacterium]